MAHLNNGSFTLDWRTENKMSKLSLILQLSFLPYNFCWDKKEIKYQSNENCHK